MHALTSEDSSPPDAAVCPPLSVIAQPVLDAHPELQLTKYNLTKPEYCSNVLALIHNAAKLEMADMCGDILPSLRGRPTGRLTEEDADDLRKWWNGFARFICTTSLVEDMVLSTAFDDVYVGFRKETRAVEKLFQKTQEKNNVYLELAIKKMGRAVEEFSSDPSEHTVLAVAKAWNIMYSMLTDIYQSAEQMVNQIDRFGTDALEYKDLEKQAAKIYTKPKRWSERDEEKRGEMIIMLTRWMIDEGLMRNWMTRYLGKSDMRKSNRWMDDYRANRLVIIDRFHHKKVADASALSGPTQSDRIVKPPNTYAGGAPVQPIAAV